MSSNASGNATLKVIGAGFGRTGTLSLKSALETLGFAPCHHMVEVIGSARQRRGWAKVAGGELNLLPEMLAGYQAQVDFPGCVFYSELMQLYPDAKVILSVRDADGWWESARNTIYEISNGVPMRWIGRFHPLLGPMITVTNELIWIKLFHGRFLDKPYAMEVFHRYNARVQEVVPADRLLVYEVKQGWEPLCAFLGVPVPSIPFPRVNDTKEFQGRIRGVKAITWGFLGAAGALVVALLYALMRMVLG